MGNGSNSWDVSLCHIRWFERLLNNHKNITSFTRDQDILFEINRKYQGDILKILYLNQYVMGLTAVQKALEEFGELNVICIGLWCKYTSTAKDFCKQNHIGLYVVGEITGAIFKDEFWNYQKKDSEENPVTFVEQR